MTSWLLRMARALRAGCVSVAIAGVHVGLLRTMGVMASSVTRKRSENRSVFCKSSYEIVTQLLVAELFRTDFEKPGLWEVLRTTKPQVAARCKEYVLGKSGKQYEKARPFSGVTAPTQYDPT